MKKTLLVILAIVLSLGALAGAGFAGFHLGYARGATTTEGKADTLFGGHRFFGPDNMPGHRFNNDDRGVHRGQMPDGFGMMHHGKGFGFASPFFSLIKIALLGLLIWAGYKLLAGRGWTLTFTRQVMEPTNESKPSEKPRKGKQ